MCILPPKATPVASEPPQPTKLNLPSYPPTHLPTYPPTPPARPSAPSSLPHPSPLPSDPSEAPSAGRASRRRVASGVTSRGPRPVPPVVKITSQAFPSLQPCASGLRAGRAVWPLARKKSRRGGWAQCRFILLSCLWKIPKACSPSNGCGSLQIARPQGLNNHKV